MGNRSKTSGSVGEQSVYTLDASPRHTAKTHGSHNGRTHTWPHVSDALDRPAHLRDVGKVRPDRHIPARHHRISHPQLRSRMGRDSLRAHQFYRTPRWVVSVRVNNLLTKVEELLTIVVCARDADEAEDLAFGLAERDRPCLAQWAEAHRR